MRRLRDNSALVSAIFLVLAGVTGAAVVQGGAWQSTVPFSLALAAFTALAVAIALRGLTATRSSLRAGGGLRFFASAVIGLVSILAVSLSGFQLVRGSRLSILDQLALPELNPRHDVIQDLIIFAIALVGLSVGELVAARCVTPLRPAARKLPGHPIRSVSGHGALRVRSKPVYLVLTVFALVIFEQGASGSLQQAVATRGTATGQGIQQIFAYSPALAVVIGVLCDHWRDRRLMLISAGLVVGSLLAGATRTPLALVAVSVAIRFVVYGASSQNPLRLLLGLLLGTYVVLVIGVAVSAWRGSVAAGVPDTLPHAITQVAGDPLSRLSSAGLDTLDGLTLATEVDRGRVGATIFDPLKAVYEFVPHQFWAAKPEFLSSVVARDYTDFGSNSGIFLSGPGYGLIVFGGEIPMMLMFVVLGFAAEAVYRRRRGLTVSATLLTYFILRFFIAGDAFDLFHVLGLCLVVFTAWVVASVLQREVLAFFGTRVLRRGGSSIRTGAFYDG